VKRSKPLEAKASTTRAWIERSRRPLERRSELAPISQRRLAEADDAVDRDEQPRRRTSTFRRKSGFTPASPDQRAKVQTQGCRVTAEHGGHVHPAHVTDRALGGCDDPLCVVGLRADLHRLYDMGEFDLLPHLTLEEQAHAASHSGLLGALQQTTGQRYVPVESRLERDYPEAS